MADKQSHLMVHLAAVLELSVMSHCLHHFDNVHQTLSCLFWLKISGLKVTAVGKIKKCLEVI